MSSHRRCGSSPHAAWRAQRQGWVFWFFKQKTAYEIYQCDWSSDVCSSDLDIATFAVAMPKSADTAPCETVTFEEIGRASCRERVQISVVAVSLKKTT